MLSDVPQVSVIIPCYNHGVYLPETVASVQVQTYAAYEIIVIDDGSNDKLTIDVLQSLSASQIKVIYSTKRGVSAARNIGISAARGLYILPLDADDTIGPTFLEKAVSLLESSPDLAVVYFERVLFGEKNGISSLPEYSPKAQLVDNLIYPAALFRRSDWERVGGYNEKMLECWEDWDFWLAISALGGGVVKISDPLFYYRVRSDSRDHAVNFRQKLIALLTIIHRHKALYLRNLGYVTAHFLRRLFNILWCFIMRRK